MTPTAARLSHENKLNSKYHITKKRKQMDLRYKELYCLLGKTSHLSVDKLLLYKSIITRIWTYGIELLDCDCSPMSLSYRDVNL
jgi:hypothetical protein